MFAMKSKVFFDVINHVTVAADRFWCQAEEGAKRDTFELSPPVFLLFR
jgi:hypothetical protein